MVASNGAQGVASSALINYLQEECEARFADLSFLKKWQKALGSWV